MAVTWKNNQCCGVFEVTGKLFKRVKCINRCEPYLDKPCDFEKKSDISSLIPDECNNSLYFFNKKLLDYGEFGDFDGICKEFGLEKSSDGKYWTAAADDFCRMLLAEGNLMYVLFCNIEGELEEQRELIFQDFTVEEHWYKLLEKSPEFYQYYAGCKSRIGTFSCEQWLELCKKFPVLYSDAVDREGCSFSDEQIIELLAIYPDLDQKAYDQLKARDCGISGDLWVKLLASGGSKSHEKFWKDCPFDKLSGKNWTALLKNQDKAVAAKARKYLRKEYGRNFTDAEWDELQRSGFKELFDHPGMMNFKSFYGAAPKHAAAAHFKSMNWIVLAGTLLVLLGGVIVSGNFSFITVSSFVLTLLYALAWSFGASWGFSRRRGGNTGMVINSAVLIAFGGWILPHGLVLLSGFMDWTNAVVMIFLSMIVIAMIVAILIVCSVLHRAVAYTAIAALTLGYVFMNINAPVKEHLTVCRKLNLDSAYIYYLKIHLKNNNFAAAWQEACRNGQKEKIDELIEIWKPEPKYVEQYELCVKQLIDGVLENPEKFKEAYGIFENHDFAKKYFVKKIIEEKRTDRKLKYAELFRELDKKNFAQAKDLQNNLFEFAKDIKLGDTPGKVSEKCQFYEVLDESSSDERQKFFVNLKKQISNCKEYPFNDKEIFKLAEFEMLRDDVDDKEFWVNLINREKVESIYSDVITHLEKLEKDKKFPKDYIDAISEKYKENWQEKSEGKWEEILKENEDKKKADALYNLKNDKKQIIEFLKEYRKTEFNFWTGWCYYYRDDTEKIWQYWQHCLEVIKNPDRAPREIAEKIDSKLRDTLAEILLKKGKTNDAVELWAICYRKSGRLADKKEYLRKILKHGSDSDKCKFLLESCENKDLQTDEILKEHVDFLIEYISKDNYSGDKASVLQNILKMYNGGIVPDRARKKLENLILKDDSLSNFRTNFAENYLKDYKWSEAWNLLKGLNAQTVADCVNRSFTDKAKRGEAFFELSMMAKSDKEGKKTDFDTVFKSLKDKLINAGGKEKQYFDDEFPAESTARKLMEESKELDFPKAMVLYYFWYKFERLKGADVRRKLIDYSRKCRRACSKDTYLTEKCDEIDKVQLKGNK